MLDHISDDWSDEVAFDSIAWAVAEGSYEDNPLILRFRQIPSSFAKSQFPTRLNVLWTMSEPDANGLPTESEMHALDVFEDRLVEAIEPNCKSILSVVLTCNGQREFVIHTVDPAMFLHELSYMPQERERYPIEIHSSDDPEWEYDESVIPSGGMGESVN